MNQSPQSPSYLSRNPYSYCFRIKIPRDLQPTFAKKELRYSLRTGYLKDAKCMARIMAGRVQQLFRAFREGGLDSMELTPELVSELIKRYHQETVEYYSKPVNPFTDDKESYDHYLSSEIKTTADLDTQIEAVHHFKKQYKFALATGQYDEVLEKAESMLKERDVQYELDSELFLTLCRGLLQVEIDGCDCDIARLSGNPIQPIPHTEPINETEQTTIPAASSTFSPTEGKLISDVIPLFIEENKVKWTPKTEQEVTASLNLLVRIIQDVQIQSVDRARIAGYKRILQKLPPNINKVKKYRRKSIQQIQEMKIDKTLSVERINKHLQRAGALFDYAINHGIYSGPNPATNMQLPNDKWDVHKRAPFTDEELKKLFISKQYLDDSFSRRYMFWTPILALFHGMRQNEIAGLHLEDIKQSDDGVWYFDLFSRKANPRDAYRVAPIHPFVLDELNFLAYIKWLKDAGHDRLFPELNKNRDGYGKAVSVWFNSRYKNKVGIESADGRMRDFHSFRTTFITRLRHKKVHDRMLKEVIGHSVHLDVTDRYTDPYPMRQLLNEVLLKADFHKQLDLSHLKDSKWVRG